MSSLAVEQVTAGVTALAAQPLGGHLDDDALARRLGDLHRLQARLAAETLRTIAELDARKAHTGRARDTAGWLTKLLGLSRPQATGAVRTATALTRLPATAALLAQGQLNPAQADVAADALAELDRLADADLPIPADATAQLDACVADRAPVCDRAVLRRELETFTHTLCAGSLADKEAAAHARRDARIKNHPDGTTSLWLRVGAAAGAKLRAYTDATARKTSPDDTRPRGQRIADAIIDLIDHGLAQTLPDVAARRPHALLITTPNALHGHPDADPSWLDGHGPVSSATAAHICCDADVTIIIRTADGTTLDAKPWRASPTKAQRAAVIARDRACIGCGAPASRCEIHHITWRRHGGTTTTDNLTLVCWNCHHDIHHHNWTVHTNQHGHFVLRPPSSTRHSP